MEKRGASVMSRIKMLNLDSLYFEKLFLTGELYCNESDYNFNIGDYISVKETKNGKYTGRNCRVRLFFALKKEYCPQNLRIAKAVMI